jgi:hypothetical protein
LSNNLAKPPASTTKEQEQEGAGNPYHIDGKKTKFAGRVRQVGVPRSKLAKPESLVRGKFG